MKKENISAYLTLLLTFILWGSIYVVSSYATNVYSPVVVACVRYVVAMLPLSIMARGKLNIKIAREDIKDLLIVAVLGYYFTITINTVGIKLSGGRQPRSQYVKLHVRKSDIKQTCRCYMSKLMQGRRADTC